MTAPVHRSHAPRSDPAHQAFVLLRTVVTALGSDRPAS
jgi:hypothetical protein